MRRYLLLALCCTAVYAAPNFGNGAVFTLEELEVTITHYEVAKNRPVIFAHFQVKNPTSEPKTCSWKDLVSLGRVEQLTLALQN